jgi:chemotaxis response regulator CheB
MNLVARQPDCTTSRLAEAVTRRHGARRAPDAAARGGRVLVEDFASRAVAGMPSAACAACSSVVVATAAEIAERLSRRSIARTIGAEG